MCPGRVVLWYRLDELSEWSVRGVFPDRLAAWDSVTMTEAGHYHVVAAGAGQPPDDVDDDDAPTISFTVLF